ncbi:MAG: hypothetical protein PHG73_10385, partial [Pygmaiobacter sp.]|nr:hypothetical protein [Pygmaiobacter sp.]
TGRGFIYIFIHPVTTIISTPALLCNLFSAYRETMEICMKTPLFLWYSAPYTTFFSLFQKISLYQTKTHTAFELHFKAVHFTKKTNSQPQNGIFLHFKVLVDFLHLCRCALPFLLHWPA